MNRAEKLSVSLMLLAMAISGGGREAHAQVQTQVQKNPPASVLRQIQAANEECKRKYPDPIRQAIAAVFCPS